VSQPSLSQQIKKLEEEVDGQLFLRRRGRIALSPLGEAFLQHAQAILASVASAEEFVAETRSQVHRTIRFGAIPTIAPYLMPDIFAALREREPSMKLGLLEDRTEALVEALMHGTIDFALLSPPTSIDSVCDRLTLLRDELLLTLPASHRLAKAKRLAPEQLAGETIILLEDSHCLSGQVAAYCASTGLAPDVSLRGTQIETLLRLVELGLGLTFTPRIAVASCDGRELVFRALSGESCHREIHLVWLRQPVIARSQRVVLRAMKEAFGLPPDVASAPRP
jgi:LysR family hydrogen peroxide-inducible transcriptional activator